ncbi:MAG: D-arabinono-1,4-lactone oxidase [Chryseolinea sp.]
MKKRHFIKVASAILTGSALSPFVSCSMENKNTEPEVKNWAGNLTYSTSNIHSPGTAEEVSAIIKKCEKLRALGTRHCFNSIADSNANLLSTRALSEVGRIEEAASTITVGAGIRYGELCELLHQKGLALHNLASLPHISVAGACATATHGSGASNGNLSTAVSAMELVTGNGEIVTLSRAADEETFDGAIVNLGMLGVVTKITLDLVPTFFMAQSVYLDLPISQLEKHFDEIMTSGYSVSLFTDWQSETINQVWIKEITAVDKSIVSRKEFFGALPASRNVHPIIEISAENCTDQMGVPGPWYERLPHFKMGFTPSSGEELQAEYFVPRDKAVEAIKKVMTLRHELKSILFISEIRAIAADELWMSPSYHQPSVSIHFTLKQNTEAVLKFLPKVEELLAPFDVRPHWGKLFTIPPSVLQSRYERLDDFIQLAHKYDPSGKFRNEFVTRHVLSKSAKK